MTRSLALRPRAEQDLAEIWDFTQNRWSQAQARSYLQGISSTFDLLLEHPEIARERGEFSPPVRIHPFRSHMIIFMSNDDTVEIVRVVHSRSNWAELLSD